MANGAFKFKDNSGNVVSFISGSGSNISFSGGTLDLSGMTGLTLGNLTLSGTTQNALSASHAASYLLTSSFNTYSGTTDTLIGTLQTSTSSLNSFSSSATTRLDNIETSTGSLNSFTSSATTRLNSIEGVSGSYATTGSNQFKNDQVITGSLTVTGFIDAQELRTTYISSSILYRSGSTKFGDELSDTHAFTGSLLVSGTISVPGSNLVSGSSQVLNGSGVFSGSAQLPSGIVSGSAQTIANLPSGTVSGSVQVDVMSTTNIARLATTGSNVFTGALTGTTFTGTGLVINNNGEVLRAYGTSPNVSFYNAANTTRGGYVNHDGSNMNIVANVGNIVLGSSATFSSAITGTTATFSDLIVTDTYANDPLIKLVTTTSGNVEVQMRTASTSYNAGIGIVTSGYDFSLFTNNTARFNIGSDGSIAMGNFSPSGTPTSDYRSFEIGRQGNTIAAAPWKSNLYLSTNATITAGSTAFTYRFSSVVASLLTLEGGAMVFSNASEGTAGNTISFTQRLTLDSSGKLGIGLTTPQAILDVSHTAGTTNIIRVSNGSGNYRWRIDQNFTMAMTNAAGVDTFSVNTSGAISTNSSITATTGLFNVNDSSTISLTSAGTNASMVKAGSGDELYLGGNDTWQMRLSGGNILMDNGGKLSIGSSSTPYNFNVYGAANSDGFGAFFGAAGTTKGGIYLGNNGTQYGTLYFDNATNNVILKQSYPSGTVNVIANTGGVYLANGGTSWTAISSDERKKKNFETTQGLIEVLQIEPIKYHFNEDDNNSTKRLGFKAQNIQPLIPEMVLETGEFAEDGSPYLTITPDYILPVLVKAIQEQQQIISDLKDRITILENN